jgi:hypothetical protein
MPLYQFKCNNCDWPQEILIMKFMDPDERRDHANSIDGECCDVCGKQCWTSQWSVPQAHSSWASTGKYGANGYYSKALGGFVDSPIAERNIMEARGFVNEADLPKNFWEDKMQQKKDQVAEQDKYINAYQDKLAAGKTKEEAVAEVFTAEDAISGKLEKTFSKESLK